MKQFVQYIVTQGQDEAEALFYARLPNRLEQQGQNLLAQIGAKGPPAQTQPDAAP
ncbi:MAG: hypothetical protein JO266_08385 [Acidobacteria bacterium]|nr:hypothetical protein [Acidobacteriota bacterium]